MTVGRFHDSNHPLFQTTDTFQQLINDLNHFGDIHDSDMRYLDSAIGPGGNLFVIGLDDFSLNSDGGRSIIDAINELDSDLHGAGGGNFKADTNTAYLTVTDAINEIERVFDASAGEILYPTGDATETETRLLISTNQSGGTDVVMNAGQNVRIDAVNDITLDAGGATITFADDSTDRIVHTMGATNTVAVTGNYTLDVSGDITLDADGNNIKFLNGAGGDEVDHNLADNADYSVTYPSNVTHTQSAGDLTFDVPGDITLDADGADIFFKDNAVTRIQHTMGATNTVAVTGNYTLDVSGDITLDVDDGDVFLKDDGTQFAALTNTSGNLILKSGTTTAMTFSGANVTVAGSITVPSTGTGAFSNDGDPTNIAATTIAEAIDEVNDRIPKIYTSAGTLLNP
jgi:hypothetical protein